MTKTEIAEFLAANDVSVRLGMQTKTYWFNQYMRMTKAELLTRLDRMTDPDEVKRIDSLMPSLAAAL